MPAGIYKRTKEHGDNISKAKKGKIPKAAGWSKGMKITMNTGKTHFKTGHIPWNKGRTYSYPKEVYDNRRGPKSPRWAGGITPLGKMIRNLSEYKLWKYAVSKRDDRTCRRCKKRSSYNHVHHLKPFAIIVQEFLQEYNQFSPYEDKDILVRLAFNYKAFWDIDNGVVLCKRCHKIILSDVN